MAGYWDGNQFIFDRPGQEAQANPLQFIGSPTVASVSAPAPSPQPSLSNSVQSGGADTGATGDENGDLSGIDVNYGSLGDVVGTMAFGPLGGLAGRGLGTLADYSKAESMLSGADLSFGSAFFDGVLGPIGDLFGTESFQEQINALDPLTKDPKLSLEMGLLDNVAPATGLFDGVDFSKGFSETSEVAQQAQADAFARGNESYGPNMAFDNDGADGEARVICTEIYHRGEMSKEDWQRDLWFSEIELTDTHITGYHWWAIPFVRVMKRNKFWYRIAKHCAQARADQIAYVCGDRKKPSALGWVIRSIGEPFCFAVGKVIEAQKVRYCL